MTITHQLLGPLTSIVGAITAIGERVLLAPNAKLLLQRAHALAEDAISICYGTSVTFSQAIGQDPSFGPEEINASEELKKLFQRLRATSSRGDLDFAFRSHDGFPTLRIDRNVFTSVMYSLIHNAMKYADQFTEVVLECSYERHTGEAVLKVKSVGEPIFPDEKELIFEKFKRGRVVSKTGRHHHGTGLGL